MDDFIEFNDFNQPSEDFIWSEFIQSIYEPRADTFDEDDNDPEYDVLKDMQTLDFDEDFDLPSTLEYLNKVEAGEIASNAEKDASADELASPATAQDAPASSLTDEQFDLLRNQLTLTVQLLTTSVLLSAKNDTFKFIGDGAKKMLEEWKQFCDTTNKASHPVHDIANLAPALQLIEQTEASLADTEKKIHLKRKISKYLSNIIFNERNVFIYDWAMPSVYYNEVSLDKAPLLLPEDYLIAMGMFYLKRPKGVFKLIPKEHLPTRSYKTIRLRVYRLRSLINSVKDTEPTDDKLYSNPLVWYLVHKTLPPFVSNFAEPEKDSYASIRAPPQWFLKMQSDLYGANPSPSSLSSSSSAISLPPRPPPKTKEGPSRLRMILPKCLYNFSIALVNAPLQSYQLRTKRQHISKPRAAKTSNVNYADASSSDEDSDEDTEHPKRRKTSAVSSEVGAQLDRIVEKALRADSSTDEEDEEEVDKFDDEGGDYNDALLERLEKELDKSPQDNGTEASNEDTDNDGYDDSSNDDEESEEGDEEEEVATEAEDDAAVEAEDEDEAAVEAEDEDEPAVEAEDDDDAAAEDEEEVTAAEVEDEEEVAVETEDIDEDINNEEEYSSGADDDEEEVDIEAEEVDEEPNADNEFYLQALLEASWTAVTNRSKRTASTSATTTSAAAKVGTSNSSSTNTTSAPDLQKESSVFLVENQLAAAGNDEYIVYQDSLIDYYLSRARRVLSFKDFRSFLELLSELNLEMSSNDDDDDDKESSEAAQVSKAYKRMHAFLVDDILSSPDYNHATRSVQELIDMLLLFLNFRQATYISQQDQFMMWHRIVKFIHDVQDYLMYVHANRATVQDSIRKMTRALNQLRQIESSNNNNIKRRIKQIFSKLLNGHKMLMVQFLSLFPDEPPPKHLMIDPNDFEWFNIDEDDGETFEVAKIPLRDEDLRYGTCKCSCICHGEQAKPDEITPTSHCTSCGIRFAKSGRIYLPNNNPARKSQFAEYVPSEDCTTTTTTNSPEWTLEEDKLLLEECRSIVISSNILELDGEVIEMVASRLMDNSTIQVERRTIEEITQRLQQLIDLLYGTK